MDIELHIERLILEGVSLPAGQREQLSAAVEGELGRLLAAQGLSPALLGGGSLPSTPAGGIQLEAGANSALLGRQIARAVYGGIGKR